MKGTAIVWYRNDLRVQDHQSLFLATQSHQRVIAYYTFDPTHYQTTSWGFKKTEKYRAQFLIETVRALQKELEALNITLVIGQKSPRVELPNLINQWNATHVYLQKEWTSEEQNTLREVQKNCVESLVFSEHYDQFLFHPSDIPFEIQQLPEVFTQFRKQCEAKASVRPLILEVQCMPKENILSERYSTPSLYDLGLDNPSQDSRTAFPFKGGTQAGKERMQYYGWESKKLSYYKKTRNGLLGKDYSSKYSAWLANGSLSPRTIYWDLMDYERNVEKNQSTYWLFFELVWRDYFKYISLKHRNYIFYLGGIKDRDYAWKNDTQTVLQWIEGQTAEPFVNANMLELKNTGWMSNRGRQNVASYLTKNLYMDWRIGAAYFEAMLIDYDVHSNYGNWMYVAGVGNDPRDRKFNISFQAQRYDSKGAYQKKWLQNTLFS
jgi:deoxyribodipyrimidine photo-lyase